jgi:hypothetical protein
MHAALLQPKPRTAERLYEYPIGIGVWTRYCTTDFDCPLCVHLAHTITNACRVDPGRDLMVDSAADCLNTLLFSSVSNWLLQLKYGLYLFRFAVEGEWAKTQTCVPALNPGKNFENYDSIVDAWIALFINMANLYWWETAHRYEDANQGG